MTIDTTDAPEQKAIKRRRIILSVILVATLVAAGAFWLSRKKGPDWMPEPAWQTLMQDMFETKDEAIRKRSKEILEGSIGRVCVMIEEDGQMKLGGSDYDVDAFTDAVSRSRLRHGDVCVVVQANPIAGMDLVESVAALCIKLGVSKVSFHVEGGGWNHAGLTTE